MNQCCRTRGGGAAPVNRCILLRLWTLRRIGPVFLASFDADPHRLEHAVACCGSASTGGTLSRDPQFLIAGAPPLAWYALAIPSLAALLRWRSRPMPAFDAALMLSLGLVPVPLFLAAVAAPYLSPRWLLGAIIAVAAYSILYLARGLRAFTGEPRRGRRCRICFRCRIRLAHRCAGRDSRRVGAL